MKTQELLRPINRHTFTQLKSDKPMIQPSYRFKAGWEDFWEGELFEPVHQAVDLVMAHATAYLVDHHVLPDSTISGNVARDNKTTDISLETMQNVIGLAEMAGPEHAKTALRLVNNCILNRMRVIRRSMETAVFGFAVPFFALAKLEPSLAIPTYWFLREV